MPKKTFVLRITIDEAYDIMDGLRCAINTDMDDENGHDDVNDAYRKLYAKVRKAAAKFQGLSSQF